MRAATCGAAVAAEAVGEEIGHVVEDRLHPGGELLVLVAGEITDVAAQGHDRAGAQHFLIDLFVEHLGQARRQGQQGFAGAGGADQGDQLDGIVQQQIQGHGLLEIARHDAEDRAAPAANGDERCRPRGCARSRCDSGRC